MKHGVLFFACLALTGLSGAESLREFQPPRWSADGSVLRLTCPQKPDAVYLRSNPERLVVEFAGSQLAGTPPAAPSLPAVNGIHWRQPDLSHVVCEVGLAYRIPAQQLRWDGSTVELETEFQWEERYKLSPSVIWTRREQGANGRYLLWNEIAVDPRDPNVALQIGLAKDRTDARERTTDMIKRHGALAGVNGGYFANSGGPLGVVYRDGKLVSPHVGRRPPRTTLGVMKDRRIEFDQVVAQKGVLASRSGTIWSDVDLALGAGPRLLARGKVALTTNEEELGPNGNDITRSCARTAVATTRDGKVLLVTVSGQRDNHLEGLRLEELAGELLRRGASEAMNLDGGASTTMAVGEEVVSYGPRAARFEKHVATALLVKDLRAAYQNYPSAIEVRCSDREVPADGSSRVDFAILVKDAAGRPVADGTPVHVYSEKLRLSKNVFPTRDGQVQFQAVVAASPGEAVLRAECAAARDEARLKLQAGPVQQLYTAVQPLRGKAGKFLVTVQAVDRWRNPVKGAVLLLGDSRQVSGANGQSTFEVEKAPGSPANTVEARCDGGPSQSVPLPAVPAEALPSPSPSNSPTP